jgi:acetate kinase
MRHVILCLNVGSSSCKCALYEMDGNAETLLAEGAAEGVGAGEGKLWINDGNGKPLFANRDSFDRLQAAVDALLDEMGHVGLPRFDAVAHRIVHGGATHVAPELLDQKLIQDLKLLIPFAPLHMPGGIEGIEAVRARFPELPQVCCFDTAFHRAMPEVAQRLPIDRALWDAGIRRYGFHGISYEYILSELGAEVPERLIIAHLGNGASMAAVLNGRPLDTTMGFTPAGGFMMGTRSGDLDPGVLLFLLQEQGYDPARLSDLINHQSGLLGVSALSSDVKTLLDAREHDPHAAQALELFCYQIRKSIGALSAALGGLQMLVFTGGIGEHASPLRAEICAGLDHLRIKLDSNANQLNAHTISSSDSGVSLRVIATNENLILARHAQKLIV